MHSEKEEKYIELIKEMRMCRICQDIKALAYCENGECLINDSHGIIPGQEADVDKIYVNRWNMWQGSLDADIWGRGFSLRKDAINCFLRIWSVATGRRGHQAWQMTHGIHSVQENIWGD